MTDSVKPSVKYVVHATGLLLAAAGVVTWARVLSEPAGHAQAAPVHEADAADPTASALAAWLGPGELRANVTVKGLIKGMDHGVAVLSVNDGPARAYRVGETLAQSVTLSAIEAHAVVIDKAGTAQRIAAPAMPQPPSPGILRAGGASTEAPR